MFKRFFGKLAIRKKYKELERVFNEDLNWRIEAFSERVYESAEGYKSCADVYKLEDNFNIAGDGYFYAGLEFLRVGEFSESADCFAKSAAMYNLSTEKNMKFKVLSNRLYAKVLRNEVNKQCELSEDKCWAVQQTNSR